MKTFKAFPFRCDPAKHRALKTMLAERHTDFQHFVEELTSAALAQWEAEKRFRAWQCKAQPPKKAAAFLRTIQRRVQKARS